MGVFNRGILLLFEFMYIQNVTEGDIKSIDWRADTHKMCCAASI